MKKVTLIASLIFLAFFYSGGFSFGRAVENKRAKSETPDLQYVNPSYNIESISVKISVNRKKSKNAYWDTDITPDIFGLIEFPSGEIIPIPLTENSFSARVRGEKIYLEKGDTIKVVLRDKDVTGFDEIANGSFVYNGKRYFTERIGNAVFSFSIKRKKK